MKEIIKYQWTDKQWTEVIKLLDDFKLVIEEEEIWSQVDNKTHHPKHEVRFKLTALRAKVKRMIKITEEH